MGVIQGIGAPAAYAAQPTPWSSLWGNPIYSPSHPYAQSFTPQLPGVPLSGYPGMIASGSYTQQQLLHSLQAAVQQVLHVVPLQLQQIQQLLQLLAQQSHPLHTQGLQPFQMPFIGGPSGWLATPQTGYPQFSGQPGYVM